MSKYLVSENTSIRKFLESFYLSKANIYKLLNSPYYINGVLSNSTSLTKGDLVEFELSILDTNDTKPFKAKLDVVYEDDYILVVNKPIKMLTHPDGTNNDTLANIVRFYYGINGLDHSVRVLHRLDYDTSGVVVFAKDALSHSFINYQIENRMFKKEYVAILEGFLEKDVGVLDFKIGRNRHDSKKYLVSSSGKSAITKYQVIQRYKNKTKVKVFIETGRTHQIRVHFSHIKHPIIGDELYGKQSDRMYLHAKSVSFIHPNSRKVIKVTKGEGKWNL